MSVANGPLPSESNADSQMPVAQLTLGHVILIAVAVGLFAVVWLLVYSQLNDLIWKNSFVTANRWMIPVGAVFFSLLVGLVQKYMRAPNVIHGGSVEPLQAGDFTGYRRFWGTLLSSFFSLFSGASVGPEGPIGFLAIDVAEWIGVRLKLGKQDMLAASLAGMSAAYNGIVGNPVFATLFATESMQGQGGFRLLASNLAAGAIGFLLFTLLKVPPFAGFLDVGEPGGLTVGYAVWAIGLGIVGAILAAYIGIAFQVLGKVMSRFDNQVVLRALVAGVIIGIVCYFIPDLMFSGETSIHTIIANPAQVGVAMLLLMALLKPLLLALSFKSGYIGGPIFPSLFTAVMMGLAISLLVPGMPLSILITCLEVAVVTLILKAPLTSILLVSVVARAGADLVGLITVAAVTAMIVGQVFQMLRAQRAAGKAAA
ncbi:MAG: chloride channel protein [Anaerolineae bacterium]